MSIIEPETDIKLWISIISQSIQSPENLSLSLPSLETVFSAIIDDHTCLISKYKIAESDFYHLINIHILNPVLQLEKINYSKNIDSKQIISKLLNAFVNFSILSLYIDDINIREITLLLFNQNNKLYKLDKNFYDEVCEYFINLGLFSRFLEYLINIPDSNATPKSTNDENKCIIIANKITFLANSLISCIPYIESEPEINWKSISLKCMVPLIKLYLYLNDKTANFVFVLVLNEMLSNKQIDLDIMKLWVTIYKLYLKTGNFSLILFTLSATVTMIKRDEFRKLLFSIFKQSDNFEIINLYLNVSINEEYCKFLQDIYSYFLFDGLITIEDLIPLWRSQQTVHISLLPSLLSIFVNFSSFVTDESAKKLTDMVLNISFLTEEWLNCVVQIGLKLNNRKQNVSKFTNLLNDINSNKFNFGKLSKEEVETFKKIADEALPKLLTNTFGSDNYLSFLVDISKKISSKQETKKEIEVLCNSLPSFNTGNKRFQQIQDLFEKIISIFPKYNITTMKKIVEVLLSERYNCTVNERLIKQLLSFTNNDKICSELYSFITDLCIQKNQIDIDTLLKVLVESDLEINFSFYRSIKSIILTLNEGGLMMNKFPFVQEDIIWHFCFFKNPQIKKFHKLLARIYMRNTNSDKEMIESFISNSIKRFKKLYYQAKSDKSKYDAIDIFSNLLLIFLEKIESYIYVPFNYHFSGNDKNKINIQINKEKTMKFDFDQRRTVSSLINYIQISNKINNDLLIIYNNKELNEKKTIEEEIGLNNLELLKNNNKSLLLSFSIQKVSNNDIRRNRTFLPSLYITNIKGLLSILLQSRSYPYLFYKLPTFKETLIQVQNLKSDDFLTFFPLEKPIMFQYNFESFLDFYSSRQLSLLQDDTANDSFIKESGMIDYLIKCGLSTLFPPLIFLILSFIKDYYSKKNEDVIDNEILAEQFIYLINNFIKQDQESQVISNIFTFKIKSLPSLSQDLLNKLLKHRIVSFREKARIFLKDIEIPLSYYSDIYDSTENEPNEEFYLSMADHILLSKKKVDRVIKITTINCQRINPYHCYLYCIEAALKKNMYDSKDKAYIANYIAKNFITEQMNCLPKYCIDYAMHIAFYLPYPVIFDAFNNLFNQFDFRDHLVRKDNSLINGDNIIFRNYARSSQKIQLNYLDFPIGLKNLGATCYINAVLQQLFNINDFRDELSSNDDSVKNDDLAKSLCRLFYELQTSFLNIANPSMFLKKYGITNTGIQCDCCEFLQELLNHLKTKIFRIRIKNVISAIDNEQVKVETYDNFDILPLPIRNISTLIDSIKHFCSNDFLKNYSFSDTKKCDAKKTNQLNAFSNHFIIQLKRFEYNHQKQICDKITSSIQIDDNLSFGNFCFKLVGVIIHVGDSADNGHYISYCRRYYSEKWFEYNDSKVIQVNHKYVLDIASKNGYLLFYSKDDNKEVNQLVFKDINDQNKYEIVCRMIFSNSFCNLMMQLCKSMNSSNIALFKVSIYYFFYYLPIYGNKDYISNFGSILLSKCKKSKENNDESFISTMLYTIFEYWSIIKMENPLLYTPHNSIHRITCDILKLVVNHIDCSEEIVNLIQESNENWLYYFYTTNEIFELISFAIEKNKEKMIQLSIQNNWISLFENLLISVIKCQKINYENLDLHYLIKIFTTIGFTDKFEDVLYKNMQFISLLLSSSTPVDDILKIILKLKQKKEVVNLLKGIQPQTKQLKLLLSKLC